LIALRGAPQLRDLFAFDEMELTAVVTCPSLLGDQGVFPQSVTDHAVAGVWEWLQRNGLPTVTNDAVHRAVDKVCMDRPFHPLRDYFIHLVWDGVSRVDDWLGTYMGAESTRYTRVVGPKWLISAIARVMQPGCKADHVLIFEGEQGLGKSTAAKVLAGGDRWFSDDLPPIGSKDCQEHLPGKWIIELSELSAVSKAETEAVKSFISRTTDKYRASFGRKQSCVPRQFVFAGSTNKNEYLRDETGNRRYWPIKCGKLDLAVLDRDRDQLWAEAFARYQKGEPWWVDENEAKEAIAAEQDQRFEEDAREEPIRSLLMRLGRVTVSDVALEALNIELSRLGRPEQNAIKGACRGSDGSQSGPKTGDGGFRGRTGSRPAGSRTVTRSTLMTPHRAAWIFCETCWKTGRCTDGELVTADGVTDGGGVIATKTLNP
jgi:predicted P-loop ATPase